VTLPACRPRGTGTLPLTGPTLTNRLLSAVGRPGVRSADFILIVNPIGYKIAVLTYKVLHDTAPRYLGPLDQVADLHCRRALRSASSCRLVVPMFRMSTVGSRTFNVSGPRIWNGLSKDVVSAPTLTLSLPAVIS